MQFAKHVQVREERFGAVVFETLKEKVFVANRTGKAILNFIEQNNGKEEIINKVAKQFGKDPDDVHGEVCDFIDQLKSNGIVVEED